MQWAGGGPPWVTQAGDERPCAVPSCPCQPGWAPRPGWAGLSAHGTELSQPSSAYLSLASCGLRCVQQPETRRAPDAHVYFYSQYLSSHMNHWARRVGPGGQRAAVAHCSLGPAFSEVLPGPHTDDLPAQETREPSQPPPQARALLVPRRSWGLVQLCYHPRVEGVVFGR